MNRKPITLADIRRDHADIIAAIKKCREQTGCLATILVASGGHTRLSGPGRNSRLHMGGMEDEIWNQPSVKLGHYPLNYRVEQRGRFRMSADAYLKAESEFEEHQKVINKLVLAIAGFQKDIQNGIVPPNWPTPEDITAAVSRRNSLEAAKKEAWNALPKDVQSRLTPGWR
jgi:hypothetical protein